MSYNRQQYSAVGSLAIYNQANPQHKKTIIIIILPGPQNIQYKALYSLPSPTKAYETYTTLVSTMRFSILFLALVTAIVIAMPATDPDQVIKLLKGRQYQNTSSTEQAKLLRGRQYQNTSTTSLGR